MYYFLALCTIRISPTSSTYRRCANFVRAQNVWFTLSQIVTIQLKKLNLRLKRVELILFPDARSGLRHRQGYSQKIGEAK